MIQKLPKIENAGNLRGKRVLLRASLNVPVKNGRILDDYRIQKALPTILYLQKKGAKIIIISHIGRNKKDTLRPIANKFNRALNLKVGFIPDLHSENVDNVVNNMMNGSVVMLENLRSDSGEVSNNKVFAKKLASIGDIYVNDAFAVSHRKHASIVGITKYLPSFAGLQLQEEVKYLSKVLNPKHPFLFIVGGVKIATKLPLLKKFTEVADETFVGGALAHSFFQELNIEIGRSFTDNSAANVQKLVRVESVKIPLDVIVKQRNKKIKNKALKDILKSDKIVDAGIETRRSFEKLVNGKKMIVFNGTLGDYENGHGKATKHLLHLIAESKAITLVGGGDTVTMIRKMKLENEFTFVSTGGGAMLDFLVDGKIPGIDALLKSHGK